MKNPVNKLIWLLALAAALFAARARAEEADVMSPTKRQEILDRAKKLLAPREMQAPATDPFHPAAFDEVVASLGRVPGTTAPTSTAGESVAAHPVGPRNDHELLQAIAPALKPSGYYVLGGEPTLVFGQKRVKAGGSVTITFEGTQYSVEITAIDRTNFTLRLNREEFTRPIK